MTTVQRWACQWCGTREAQTRRDESLPERKTRCRECYLASGGTDRRWRKLAITSHWLSGARKPAKAKRKGRAR